MVKALVRSQQELNIDVDHEPFGAICRAPAHDRGSVGRASFLTALTDCRWWFDSLLVRE